MGTGERTTMLWQIVSVIVVLCTFLMPRTLQAQQATLRFGDVSGSHGETVNIDVFASFNLPIHGANIPFTFDEDRLEFVDHDLRGTAAETINPGVAYSIVPEPGKGFLQFLSFEKNKTCFDISTWLSCDLHPVMLIQHDLRLLQEVSSLVLIPASRAC